jgi:hypothetical protein
MNYWSEAWEIWHGVFINIPTNCIRNIVYGSSIYEQGSSTELSDMSNRFNVDVICTSVISSSPTRT